jgi:hypothetical protein
MVQASPRHSLKYGILFTFSTSVLLIAVFIYELFAASWVFQPLKINPLLGVDGAALVQSGARNNVKIIDQQEVGNSTKIIYSVLVCLDKPVSNNLIPPTTLPNLGMEVLDITVSPRRSAPLGDQPFGFHYSFLPTRVSTWNDEDFLGVY